MVVVLRYWGELSLAEIADRLRIPIGTVKSRHSRGPAGAAPPDRAGGREQPMNDPEVDDGLDLEMDAAPGHASPGTRANLPSPDAVAELPWTVQLDRAGEGARACFRATMGGFGGVRSRGHSPSLGWE